MWQVEAKSGAVKSYYSWSVQNPSEVFHDEMVEVDSAGHGSTSVYVEWSDEAQRQARNVTVVDTNTTIIVSPLYGSVVGVSDGRNEFTLSYKDSAHRLLTAGHLLSILTASAFAVLMHSCF